MRVKCFLERINNLYMEESWKPNLVHRHEHCPVKVIEWGCICCSGAGTLAKVDGNINAEKFINMQGPVVQS